MASLIDIMSEQLAEDLEKDADFEKALRESEKYSAVGSEPDHHDVCEHDDEDDEALARRLQESFDEEYAFSLENAKQPVGSGKVARVSCRSEEIDSENVPDGEEDPHEWTNFVRRYRDGTPMLFSNLDQNGEVITKHNPQLCGMRNAKLVEKFVENSGNMDGHVLSNEVIGSLKNNRKMTHKK